MSSIFARVLVSSVTSVCPKNMTPKSLAMRRVMCGRRSSRNHLRRFLDLHISRLRCLLIAFFRGVKEALRIVCELLVS